MRKAHIVFALVFFGAANITCGQSSLDVQGEVINILDNWKSRVDASAEIQELGQQGIEYLSAIATNDSEPYTRRTRSITLLGSLPPSQAVPALSIIATSAKPLFRCLALQTLSGTFSEEAIESIISQLDNDAPCMFKNSTDPARVTTILVSDEAVRSLEIITGKSFDPNARFGDHRATEPWKKWWQERKGENLGGRDRKGTDLPNGDGPGQNNIK